MCYICNIVLQHRLLVKRIFWGPRRPHTGGNASVNECARLLSPRARSFTLAFLPIELLFENSSTKILNDQKFLALSLFLVLHL